MDFQLTEEQRIFEDSVRGIAERHLGDGALERAHDPGYPRDVAKLLADNGLMGSTLR